MDAGTTVDKVGLHLLEYLIINQYNFVDCHFFSVNHSFACLLTITLLFLYRMHLLMLYI